jgi:hypothetical protein
MMTGADESCLTEYLKKLSLIGGEQQIGTAERILAEIISSDVALLVTHSIKQSKASSKTTKRPGKTLRRSPSSTVTSAGWQTA